MSERTDDREVEDLVDGDIDVDAGSGGDVGLDDDELGVDVDALTSDLGGGGGSASGSESERATAGAEASADSGPGLLSRLTPSIGRPSLAPDVPSLRSFLLAALLVIGGMFVGSAVPFVGSVTGLIGMFAGAFLLGVGSGKRRYAPVAVAGAGAAVAATMMQGVLTLTVVESLGLGPTAALGATTGVLVAVIGHYFGRDLRAGLTRDV